MRSPSRRPLSTVLTLAVVGVLAGSSLGLGSAEAANPNEGTLTDTSGAVTWTGGPFSQDNASALLLSPPQ